MIRFEDIGLACIVILVGTLVVFIGGRQCPWKGIERWLLPLKANR